MQPGRPRYPAARRSSPVAYPRRPAVRFDHDQFPLDGTSCSSATKVLAASAWHKTALTSHRIAPISAGRCQGLYVSVPKPGRRVHELRRGPSVGVQVHELPGGPLLRGDAPRLGRLSPSAVRDRASWQPVAALLQRTHRVPASAEERRPLACSSRGCGESPAASAFRTRQATPAVRDKLYISLEVLA